MEIAVAAGALGGMRFAFGHLRFAPVVASLIESASEGVEEAVRGCGCM
jgi:hypothetical protein